MVYSHQSARKMPSRVIVAQVPSTNLTTKSLIHTNPAFAVPLTIKKQLWRPATGRPGIIVYFSLLSATEFDRGPASAFQKTIQHYPTLFDFEWSQSRAGLLAKDVVLSTYYLVWGNSFGFGLNSRRWRLHHHVFLHHGEVKKNMVVVTTHVFVVMLKTSHS